MASVAVVVLDTLRYDSFTEEFDWLDGKRFSRAYSTSHWTVPAHASLFTGEYASNVGVHGRSPTLDCEKQTLAEAFQQAGYRTRAFNANTQLTQYEGWDRGFDEFVGKANLGRTDDAIFDWGRHIDETSPGLRRHFAGLARCFSPHVDTVRSLQYGYELFQNEAYRGGAEAVAKRVAATDFGDEVFLFVNLMDAHTPYYPPPGSDDSATVVVADAFSEAAVDGDRLRAAYRQSVGRLSELYQDIHAALCDSFDYVITLSDHGELLGEHGLWNHSVSLHPELVQIPLVINGPDIEPGRCHEPVSILDVHQTIGDLAGIDVDSAGRNLLDDILPTEYLVESHGLLPFHEAQFEREDVSRECFERWQQPLYGFLTRDGAYCYESEPGEFCCLGETALMEPQNRLAELTAQLEEPTDDDRHEVSEDLRSQLKQLGYA